MNAYDVEIIETLVHRFTIVADSVEDAEKAAKKSRCDKTVTVCTDLQVKILSLGRKI